jgi:phosphatidylinositol alpha-1,6-mannosyltransferase
VRVLLLTPGVFDKGGIARYNRFQIRALREQYGEEAVSVCSLIGDGNDGLGEPMATTWAGDPVVTNRSRALFSSAVLRHAYGMRPDVVVCCHVNLGPLAAAAATLRRSAVLQTVYGIEIWSGLSRPRRKALSSADLVVSDCVNTAEEAMRLRLVDRMPEVVWDCADLSRYRPGPPDPAVLDRYGVQASDRFRILFLARLNPDTRYKGTERVLQLLARLPDSFEVVFGGQGDDVEHLRDVARQLGIAERVRFTGAIDEADLPDIYRSATVFYLTSQTGKFMGEGIPLTPIEALACGIPVVVGNSDGSRELLDAGGGHCGDPLELESQAEYVLGLQADHEHCHGEQLAARARAEAAFSFEAFAEKTIRAVELSVRRHRRTEDDGIGVVHNV